MQHVSWKLTRFQSMFLEDCSVKMILVTLEFVADKLSLPERLLWESLLTQRFVRRDFAVLRSFRFK